MRSNILRVYKSVHTWAGIVSALLLFIAFYAGALTMFEASLDAWVAPGVAQLPAVPLERADRLIELARTAYPEARAQFWLDLPDPAHARFTWNAHDGCRWAAWLDTHDAIQAAPAQCAGAPDFINLLHMTGGLPGGYVFGSTVMGLVSLLYGLALVSGVIVLLPTLVKDLFALRFGANLKRLWLDIHNLLGVMSLPFHLVIALSVVAFGLGEGIYALQDKTVYQGALSTIRGAQNPYYGPAPLHPQPARLLAPAHLLTTLEARAPDFVPSSMGYRNVDGTATSGATVYVAGSDPRYLSGRGVALLDPVDGHLLNTAFLPGDDNRWASLLNAFEALHFGSYAGVAGRWAYFLLGMAGAALFYTGNLLWIESRRRKPRRDGETIDQRRASVVLARLTVGVALGCVTGISMTLALDKLCAPHAAAPQTWAAHTYYAVFVACVAWAFMRHPARAACELCLLAALATAALPAISLCCALSGHGTIDIGDLSARAVDAAALFMAALLVWASRRVTRRARTGAADSVWSLGGRTR